MDFGTWEGQDWNDIPRMELDAWAADFPHVRLHAGASVHEVLAELQKEGISRRSVTHAGVIKASTVAKGTASFQASVAYGGVLRL